MRRISDGKINCDAWTKTYPHLRAPIIESASRAAWSNDDFEKIATSLAEFTKQGLGHKKAWQFVIEKIDLEKWARNPRSS